MKDKLLWLLFTVGFLKIWCFFRRDKITIITLHGVMDSGLPSKWETLRPRTSRQLFDESLGLAKNYFNFVSIDDAVEMLKGHIPIKSNSCVVTFDDGQLNNKQVALPILRKHEIPVLFYPTTGILDQGATYWFDRLDFAIQQPGLHGLKINVGEVEVVVDQSSRKYLAQSLAALIRSLKKRDQSDEAFKNEIDQICTQMEKSSGRSINDLGNEDLWSSLMSSQDIADCAAMDDVTIGSHTVNHVRLPFTERSERLKELSESKKTLDELTGQSCVHFCYPNGDWDEPSALDVESAGYETAVTTTPGANDVGDNLYTLKRFNFPEKGTPIRVLFSITGFFLFVSRLRSK